MGSQYEVTYQNRLDNDEEKRNMSKNLERRHKCLWVANLNVSSTLLK
jgi:hypothetical protein